MTEPSAVDALLADCRAVVDAIAQHKAAVARLTADRDRMVAELRRLGLPERAVGRLLGISGPRVNQIMQASDIPVVVDERMPEGAAVVVSGADTAVIPVPPVVLRAPEPGGSR